MTTESRDRWRHLRRAAKHLVAIFVFTVPIGLAQEADRTLVVGTRHIPPFAIHQEDGQWSGITIELWNGIASDLGLKFGFREVKLSDMIPLLEDGTLDVVAAALTITADREALIDFSHPFLNTGLAIAARPASGAGWSAVLGRLLSSGFLKILGLLFLFLLVSGILIWLLERRQNSEQFDRRFSRGVGEGLWWSAVTLTTVGYGDRAPKSLGGRAVAVIWMIGSIFIISGFTAGIASTLTVSRLESRIQGPEDLRGLLVATVNGSTSEAFLQRERIRSQAFETPIEGLAAVERGEVDAMVYDAPILRYLALHEMQSRIQVTVREFEPQDYGIALQSGSPYREDINRRLLRRLGLPGWQELLFDYIGR